MKTIKYFLAIILLFCNLTLQSNTLYDQAKELLDNQTPSNTLRFAVLSDTHYGYTYNDNHAMINAILDTLSNMTPKPDFIIICGDAYEDGNWIDDFYDYLIDVPGWMVITEIPVFIVVGNHDFTEYHPDNDYDSVYHLYKELINPFWNEDLDSNGADTAWDYYFDYGDSNRFVITNNTFHPISGHLDEPSNKIYKITDAQFDNLSNELNVNKENKFCFAHAPTMFELVDYKFAYRDSLNKYGVKANFSGHMHYYIRYSEPDFMDITVGQSGSKGAFDTSNMKPPFKNDLPNWVMVTIVKKDGDDEINMELHEVETVSPYSSEIQPSYQCYAPYIREVLNEPIQKQFIIGAIPDTTLINSEHPDFDIEGMVFGWQWGGNIHLTRAMNMNQTHYSDATIDLDEIPDSSYVIRGTDGIWANAGNGTNAMQAMGIQYEPALKITNPGSFKTREADSADPVFGFRYIHDDVGFTDTTIILIDSICSGEVVLKNIWPGDTKETIHRGSSHNTNPESNGKKFYIDMQVKKHDIFNNTADGDSVLQVKVKYKKNGSSTWNDIKFSQIPYGGNLEWGTFLRYDEKYTSLDEYRGKFRNLIHSDSIPHTDIDSIAKFDTTLQDTVMYYDTTQYHTHIDSSLYVEDKMLPFMCEPIMLSGYFVCDGLKNPIIIDSKNDSLDIEVTYLGNTDIEIDWIRLVTPHARRLLLGEFDSLIVANTQRDLDSLTKNDKGLKAIRFYTRDEIGTSFWLACRYYNRLVGNLGTTEEDGAYDSLFRYYVGAKERWINMGSPGRRVAAPFLYTTDDDNITFPKYAYGLGLGPGYNGINRNDVLTSGYETFICRNGDSTASYAYTMKFLDTIQNLIEYRKKIEYMYMKSSFQGYLESVAYRDFVQDKKFLYSGDIWWHHELLGCNFDTVQDVTVENGLYIKAGDANRQKTGEEFRSLIMSHILKGAKGLLFDRDRAHDSFIDDYKCWTGLMAYGKEDIIDSVTDNGIIYSDSIGGDFVINNDPNGLDKHIPLSTIADSQHVSIDRIYVGQKSTRVELKHIIDYCKENENTLMNLQLQAWFGKGYKTWYNQHGDYNDSILKNFVSLDTADWKLRRTAVYDSTLFLTEEPWDSAFFDVTLLRDKRQSMDTVFYIGIQNRRTDPLILYPGLDIEPMIENNYMRFLTTAEFYDSCNESKNLESYARMRELYLRRLGCREITIPFNFLNTIKTQNKCMLQIAELGGDLYLQDTSKWFWRSPVYYKYIDTTIWEDKDLVVRLLPGEGKFLKVTVLRGDNNISGYLEHSNQTKIVAHPILDGERETDSIRYHSVYFKKVNDSCALSPYGIFYRRSSILDGGCSPNELINWENEIYLSYNINGECIFPWSYDTLSCDHPSIIVRKKDDSTLYAYIVYDCLPYKTPSICGYIVESILEVNGGTASLISTHAIGSYDGAENDSSERKIEWGTPVVNASANGNYYAWSDSIKFSQDNPNDFEGIVIGYRSLNSPNYCLEDSAISWNGGKPRHPSVNPYSLIDEGENECALVWQEEFDNRDNIFCTRLKYDENNNKITYYFPKNRYYTSTYLNFNQDSTIIHINNLYNNNNTYPVIYRSLDFLDYYSIYWQSDPDKVGWNMRIGNGQIYFKGNSQNQMYNARVPNLIWSPIYNLSQPNVSQGFDDTLSQGEHIYYHMLGFLNNNNIFEVGRVPQMISFDNSFSKTSFESLWQVSDISSGYQPHLSSNKDYLSFNEKWKNRRIFNTDSQSNVNIETSNRDLYRRTENEVNYEGYAGFASNTFYYYVGYASIDGEDLSWNLPYYEVIDSLNRKYYEPYNGDSIYTDYFNVAPLTTADIDFMVYANNATSTTIGLEGHPSYTFTVLPIPQNTTDSTGTLLQYTFVNMLNTEYRLIFINHDSTAEYNEELVIGGLPVGDTILAKRGENYGGRIIIDLETGQTRKLTEAGKMELKVFPNPAKDEVFVTVNYPVKYMLENSDNINKAKVRLFSITGEKLYEFLVRPGETIRIPTTEFTQGLYFIQAEEKIDKWQLDYLAPTVERVMIER
ncbi:MAG: metallophosphoesterase [bacterium]